MRTKLNKQLGRWGIWIDVLNLWMVNLNTEKPIVFQQKQEAQKEINKFNVYKS